MKARIIKLAELAFVWTAGPVLLLMFSKKPAAKVARVTALAGGGLVAAWWTGLLLYVAGALVALVPGAWLGGPLAPQERQILMRTLTETVDEDHPLYLHAVRTERRALRFGALEGVPAGAVAAATWLTNSAQEHPAVPEGSRFCIHGNTGALISLRVLRQLPERNAWMALVVADAVVRHVAPTGYNWEWQDKRWVSKTCPGQRLPGPVGRISKVVHDVEALDDLTVDHVLAQASVKMAHDKRPHLQAVLQTGKDSVLKEQSDTVQVLATRTGRACGRKLGKHTAAFIRTLDYTRVKTMSQLQQAAQAYVKDKPTPACLDNPENRLLEDPDGEDLEPGTITGMGPD